MFDASRSYPENRPVSAADRVRRLALIRERDYVIAVDGDPSDPRFGPAWMAAMLPHYCKSPLTGYPIAGADWHPSFMHEVYSGLGSGMALAVEASRGSAKSTIGTLAVVLAALAREWKRYAWIVSESSSQSRLLMASVIAELDGNQALLQAFPGLQRAYDSRRRPVSDTDTAIVFANGARLEAIGAGQKLRGRRHGQDRPDLAIVDDVCGEANTNTREQRDRLDAWFSGALLPALGPTADVIVLGTPIHSDDLTSRLSKREGWTARRYPLLRDPSDLSSSVWPALWPPERLRELRQRIGAPAWSREILLTPVSEDTQLFPRSRYRYDRMRSRLLEGDGETRARIRIAVDPAVGLKRTNDQTAIAITAQLGRSQEHHVLDVILGRWTGREIAERVAAEHARWRRYSPVTIAESVQSQEWLAQALRDRGIPVRSVTPNRDKILRAEPVALLYEQGSVWHDEHLRDSPFEEQLEQFPAGQHDDAVDACVYGITDATNRRNPSIRQL